ncbi:MAG TPA: hypothetical protein VGI90_07940 [Steroidobacteraceae bacterium]
MQAESVHRRQQNENWRLTVFFGVLFLHVSIGVLLARSSWLLIAARPGPEPFFIDFLQRPDRTEPARETGVARAAMSKA